MKKESKPRPVEEHCAVCDLPIYESDGRYRNGKIVHCLKCEELRGTTFECQEE